MQSSNRLQYAKQMMEDRIRVYVTLYLITINPINSVISHYLKLVGIRVGDISLILYMGALAAAAYWILKNGLDVYDFGWLLAAYLFYGLQWLLCKPDVRRYLTQGSILAIYRFYLPTVFLMTKNVKNWRILYTDKLCIRYADVMTILALIMKLTSTKAVNRYSYMDFSYSFLPIWGLVVIVALRTRRLSQCILAAIGILTCTIYGARGTLLWLLLLVLVLFIFYKAGLPYLNVIGKRLSLLLGLAIIGLQIVLPIILNSSFAADSYLLQRLARGEITDSSGRDDISDLCMEAMMNMKLTDYNGLFYDRTILGGYAHNIALEALLSFGWIYGSLLLLGLFGYIGYKFMVCTGEDKLNLVYFTCVLFLRYFISGSIYLEGNFWIYIGVLMSIKRAPALPQTNVRERMR